MSINDLLETDIQDIIWKYTVIVKDELTNYLYSAGENVLLWIFCYLFICALLYVLSVHYNIRPCRINDTARRALFIVAHPDDECMFFGPTILNFIKNGIQIHFVCLSNGNYEEKGSLRQSELWKACEALGISIKNITMYIDTLLPDNPNKKWPTERVADIILHHVMVYEVDTVVTFDRGGVSHHPNHSSIFYAIAYLMVERRFPRACKVLTLDSVNIIRKYWGYLDLPLSYLLSSNRYVLSLQERRIVVNAMAEHKSQMLWFRKLYLLFSRFIVINTLKEVTILDIELDLELDD